MADRELRQAIAAAIDADPAYHSHVKWMLGVWQQRSKEDIERSHLVCAAELQPKVTVPEGVAPIWRIGAYVIPLMAPQTSPASPDLLAIIRDIARSG